MKIIQALLKVILFPLKLVTMLFNFFGKIIEGIKVIFGLAFVAIGGVLVILFYILVFIIVVFALYSMTKFIYESYQLEGISYLVSTIIFLFSVFYFSHIYNKILFVIVPLLISSSIIIRFLNWMFFYKEIPSWEIIFHSITMFSFLIFQYIKMIGICPKCKSRATSLNSSKKIVLPIKHTSTKVTRFSDGTENKDVTENIINEDYYDVSLTCKKCGHKFVSRESDVVAATHGVKID